MEDPPPYEEVSHCRVCNCQFTMLKRRHHCRACGRSLCKEHSSNQKALPQFGIYTPVRVCDDCLKPPKPKARSVTTKKVEEPVEKTSASFSKMNLSSAGREEDDVAPAPPPTPAFKCVCGMPLCICEAPAPTPAPAPELRSPSPSPATQQVRLKRPSPAPAKTSSLARTSSYGNTMPSLFFQNGNSSQGSSRSASKLYEPNGEGLREAVMAADIAAVKDLLARGLNPNHVDKQGMSLLHLAAMFNFTEITFMLMDAGANVSAKNSQGESPVDCAQTTLSYKMRQRIEAASLS
ncbi:uncharacterized protein [Physcomitrium patens]|uniref:FYVE-type domain-containing protein n=1 Tax=Physcomitrium patens TaxID=3218 RepID=A9RNX0_PHYPA|nr:hepatocyte growth factor-regulated tyrosine kinase substrate-like isoform X2 [Physcomitrium patens]PNR35085.1 hypothetical protein PHYPA_022984 [Physcomitrium patens]|eukprot:XP_024402157.1 hepatocyte growth factor-regulated tyrosine kinase substrate-like isoform X2 [Physcomitrella patens]